MVAKACRLIDRLFKDKVDLSGEPYSSHLYRVANRFVDVTYTVIALLHDVLEDCPDYTEQELRESFGDQVANTVKILTKGRGEDYDLYIDRVSRDECATQIKLADLRDNMDLMRLKKPLTDKDMKRIRKYHKAYLYLKDKWASEN